jgi:hypothetical protein
VDRNYRGLIRSKEKEEFVLFSQTIGEEKKGERGDNQRRRLKEGSSILPRIRISYFQRQAWVEKRKGVL